MALFYITLRGGTNTYGVYSVRQDTPKQNSVPTTYFFIYKDNTWVWVPETEVIPQEFDGIGDFEDVG